MADRKRLIAHRPIKSVAPRDQVRRRSTTVLTKRRDKEEEREGNYQEWRREGQVGNERTLVDQWEAQRSETMCDDMEG